MKKIVLLILLILFSLALFIYCLISDIEYEKNNNDSNENVKADKILVVYFSLTGNSGKVANMIKDITGGDIFEIQPDFDYSKVESMKEMEELGKEQVENGFRPELKNSIKDIEAYDLIIIGSPVWWFSVSPPLMSFLSQYDLKDTKVAPFCTCISHMGDFFTQIKEEIPDAKVLEGLTIYESDLKDEEEARETIEAWLEELLE